MSKVEFKYPLGAEAKDAVTGFPGVLIVRKENINGSISYGLQPTIGKEDSTYVPDAKIIDEVDVALTGPEVGKPEKVEFKFECGQYVRNHINGFEGVVQQRIEWKNGCVEYQVEAAAMKSELHGMVFLKKNFWEQELEAQKKKTAKVAKKRTGGPSYRETLVETCTQTL